MVTKQLSDNALFASRKEAGQKLAKKLIEYKKSKPLILALPRGGVEVGFEVAQFLESPLHVLLVHKIGSPYNPEFAVGAVAEGNVISLNHETLKHLMLNEKNLKNSILESKQTIAKRKQLYRDNKPLVPLKNKTVIIVDDGIATGETVIASIKRVRQDKPKSIIIATPVCAYETAARLQPEVTKLVALIVPEYLSSISNYYMDFPQTSDETVIKLLTNS